MKLKSILVTGALLLALSACNKYSHTNIQLTKPDNKTEVTRATFDIDSNRGETDTLFVLSLSGGGSRAAYLSANVMLELQQVFADEIDLLAEVDLISSVSGGSLAAAYYGISADTKDDSTGYGRVWDKKSVRKQLSKNFQARWFSSWFIPTNAIKYWFTAFDRTDIMAKVLADTLFDTPLNGKNFTMADLREKRPFLIINAADSTRVPGLVNDDCQSPDSEGDSFGRFFTFTDTDFSTLNSDIDRYDLARAVMGSSAFPAAFNHMTLKDYSAQDDATFKHIFDGGNVDNLGLKSIKRAINHVKCAESTEKPFPKKIVVILIDAYTTGGVDPSLADARSFFDFVIDTNFIDAVSSLMTANRGNIIADFRSYLKSLEQEKAGTETLFYHLQFDNLTDRLQVAQPSEKTTLLNKLNRIPTNFALTKREAKTLNTFTDQLIQPTNRCLQAIKELINSNNQSEPETNLNEIAVTSRALSCL